MKNLNKYKIDGKTRYDENFQALEEYFTESQKDAITKAALKDKYGSPDFMGMTIEDFFKCIAGNFAPLVSKRGNLVFDAYRVKYFVIWLEDFFAVIERVTLPTTAKQKALSNGCVDIEFETSVYTFLRNYFGLKSFKEVDSLTIADYIIAKTDAYNKQVVDNNISKSMQ